MAPTAGGGETDYAEALPGEPDKDGEAVHGDRGDAGGDAGVQPA